LLAVRSFLGGSRQYRTKKNKQRQRGKNK